MVEERIQRRLAAILAADVAGYSRLMSDDEEATLATLRGYRNFVDKLITDHGGRIFGSAGDSVIAEFPSPIEAVRSATEIQNHLDESNADLPEPRRMRFRIGIHLGDVMVEGDNLMGDGVNVAARLESMAPAGGLCISDNVFSHVRERLGLEFEDLGQQQVKNISHPVHVYRVPLASEFRNVSPFRGLNAFEYDDARFFHGRGKAIGIAKERLESQAAAGIAFLLIYGMSGVGKSSLVRAGLLPVMTGSGAIQGIEIARYSIFRPSEGSDPRVALCLALQHDHAVPELRAQPNIESLVREDPEGFVAAVIDTLSREYGSTSHLIIAVDQLEELFTSEGCDAASREGFIGLVSLLVRSGSVWVAATIRTDFLHHCAGVPGLSELKDGLRSYELLPPSGPEIAQMIRNPARTVGLRFEEHVEEGRLEDVLQQAAASDPASLPLLEFILDALYELGKERRELTFADYHALGGLEGAIARRADDVIAALPDEVQAALPSVFRSLVTVRLRDEAVTARPVTKDEIASTTSQAALTEALVEARLLVSDEDESGNAVIRIAHEALLSQWPRAQQIIAADREFLEIRARVTADSRRWLADEKNPDLLLPGGKRAAEAAELLITRRADLEDQVVDYIEASTAALHKREEAEREAERQQLELEAAAAREREASARRLARRTRVSAAVILILAVVAGIGALVGFKGQREATRQAELAEENAAQARLAEQESERQAQVAIAASKEALRNQSLSLAGLVSEQIASVETTPAILLALEALPQDMANPNRPFVIEAEAALYRALMAHSAVVTFRHQEGVTSAAFDPSSDRIVTSSFDGTARLWNAADGSEITILSGHESAVEYATFSPDGRRIVTAARDGTTRIWNAETGQNLLNLNVGGKAQTATFSPNGDRVAIAAIDGQMGVWDARTGDRVASLASPSRGSLYISYSTDGHMLVSSHFHEVRLWNAVDGQQIATLPHEGWVSRAKFSPDGSRLLTVIEGVLPARLYDVDRLTEIAILEGHKSEVFEGGFSPDGRLAATISIEGSARLWDAQTGQLLQILGEETSIDRVDAGLSEDDLAMNGAFSPDSSLLATASVDGLIRVWDVVNGSAASVLRGHKGPVEHVEFHPDGSHLLSASHGGTARLWDVDGVLTTSLRHESRPTFAAFSADGRHIVTTTVDRAAHIWDVAQGRRLASARGHRGRIVHAAFDPIGDRIATASNDGTIGLWDVRTGNEIGRLVGHDDAVTYVQFNPDGKLLLSASNDKTARLWDTSSNAELAAMEASNKIAYPSAVLSPDGRLILTTLDDNTARLSKTDGTELHALTGHEREINAIAFSPNGEIVATASRDRTVRIWSTADGSEMTLLDRTGLLNHIAFSPDGQSIVVSSPDRMARVWNVNDGTVDAALGPHDGAVMHAEFSANGKQVLTRSFEGTTSLWDARTGVNLVAIPAQEKRKRILDWGHTALSRDGTHLLTISGGNVARIIRIFPTTQDLIDYARSLAPRELTPCERSRFFLPVEDEIRDCTD